MTGLVIREFLPTELTSIEIVQQLRVAVDAALPQTDNPNRRFNRIYESILNRTMQAWFCADSTARIQSIVITQIINDFINSQKLLLLYVGWSPETFDAVWETFWNVLSNYGRHNKCDSIYFVTRNEQVLKNLRYVEPLTTITYETGVYLQL